MDPFTGLSFKVGVAENKNTAYRNKMEDVHTYIANFAERVDWGYFAIFDGHAGKDCARYCGNNMHQLLEKEIDAREPDLAPQVGQHDMRELLNRVFCMADLAIETQGVGTLGCTAAVAVLRWETDPSKGDATEKKDDKPPGDGGKTGGAQTGGAKTGGVSGAGDPTSTSEPGAKTGGVSGFEFTPQPCHRRMMYTLNVGDLRIVLCRAGVPYRLTYDHKATDLLEVARIQELGGLIMKNRVNGVLAVTRSLGDCYMKDLVIGRPFTAATEITRDDEFMILACDGVWDVLLDARACQFVAEQFRHEADASVVAKKLCQLAIDSLTTDNVTVMVVKFEPGVFGTEGSA